VVNVRRQTLTSTDDRVSQERNFAFFVVSDTDLLEFRPAKERLSLQEEMLYALGASHLCGTSRWKVEPYLAYSGEYVAGVPTKTPLY